MKLSSETLTKLKNFAGINSNLVIHQGNTIKTIAEAKNIFGFTQIAETFPDTFGIYDLNEFLGVVNMFDAPDVVLTEKFATISEGKRSVKYFFSDISILTSPAKDIKMPECEVVFTLTDADISAIRRASSTLGLSDLVITREGDSVILRVTDTKDSTSNHYDIELDNVTTLGTESFSLVFSIPNLKMMTGDYEVSLSSKLISKFDNKKDNVQYFIALEKSSTYGE